MQICCSTLTRDSNENEHITNEIYQKAIILQKEACFSNAPQPLHQKGLICTKGKVGIKFRLQ